MKILPLIIAATVLLMSCEKKQAVSSETKVGSDSIKMVDSSTGISSSEKPEILPSNEVVSAQNQAVTKNTASKPAINPAHGEPFHRCDIAVGAPIDSAPQQAAPQPVSAPQMQTNNTSFNTNPISHSVSAPNSAPQALGPKPALNPAHGEPHHRCDLQVGAPLT